MSSNSPRGSEMGLFASNCCFGSGQRMKITLRNSTRSVRRAMLLGASLILIFSQSGVPLRAEDGVNLLPKKQHRDSDAPFLSPAEAVSKMSIPEGFDVSVFAAEPDIAEPIAFCFDDRGRMWIAENFNYQTRRQHTDDRVSRIQILEDTDSDGVFDKKKTFTDQLTFTSGLACGFGGVFVGSPPHLTFIPDKDEDDVPDGPPKVLLDGWGINDRHETLNSFIWGPDGWLYGCHGVFTESRVGKPGDDDSDRQFIDGGIWRYHPVRGTFEIFARGLSNPWGFDFNDHGQGFATCCVIPHLFHVVQGGTYHKQSRPHVNPYVYDDIKTIRDHSHLSAHGGARFYLADTFPEQYHDRLFMCNIHEHAVLTDVMVPSGSSYIGKHGNDFMPTNDLAWVGFSVEIGPEGGVYLLDWHDQDVCGNAVKFPNSGRVYRVMPEGHQPGPRPNLRAASDADLVELQKHSNDWYVRQARTLLHYRAVSGTLDHQLVHGLLRSQMRDATTSPRRLRALWALHVTGGLSDQDLRGLLEHADPYIRSWGIQLLTDGSGCNAFQANSELGISLDENLLKRFSLMAREDESPVVRLYLASAAQRLQYAHRWELLAGLISHAEDVSDNNLPRMYWFALEPMVPGNPEKSLTLAVGGEIPQIQEFVARRLVTGDLDPSSLGDAQRSAQWNKAVQTLMSGLQVASVGEGGVVRHASFRNRTAVQTHPKDRKTPCVISSKQVQIPAGKQTSLRLCVSHHPHGDWLLRVTANQEVIAEQLVSSATVKPDEWLDVSVDLSRFAGHPVSLSIENVANDWHNEWAYWNKIQVVSE